MIHFIFNICRTCIERKNPCPVSRLMFTCSAMDQNGVQATEFKHPRIECGICGMHISQKHLGRHRMRRHPSCPSNEKMVERKSNHPSRPSNSNQPNPSRSNQPAPKQSTQNHSAQCSTAQNVEIRQSIADQSKKPFSDEIRFVKVRMSEDELIKLMNSGRIYHAVGKFFMYDS